MLPILSEPQEFSNCVRFSLWGCYNWSWCDINNVGFIARWQQNTPANHMAAVHGGGVSQVAKEMRWRRCRDTAVTTLCRLAPVCEILITLNNLLIYPHTHRTSTWPKKFRGRHSHRLARRKGCDSVIGVSYKKRVRIICLKKDKKIKSDFAMLVQIDLLTSTDQ